MKGVNSLLLIFGLLLENTCGQSPTPAPFPSSLTWEVSSTTLPNLSDAFFCASVHPDTGELFIFGGEKGYISYYPNVDDLSSPSPTSSWSFLYEYPDVTGYEGGITSCYVHKSTIGDLFYMGSIFPYGGDVTDPTSHGKLLIFNMTSKSFISSTNYEATMAKPTLLGCTVAVEEYNFVFQFGGYIYYQQNEAIYQTYTQIYDISLDRWTYGDSLATGGYGMCCEYYDKNIYIIGGFNGAYLKDVQIYNVETNVMSDLGNILDRSGRVRAYPFINPPTRYIYIIAGSTNGYESTSSVTVFDTLVYTFTTNSYLDSSYNGNRSRYAAVMYNHVIYVLGGADTLGDVIQSIQYAILPNLPTPLPTNSPTLNPVPVPTDQPTLKPSSPPTKLPPTYYPSTDPTTAPISSSPTTSDQIVDDGTDSSIANNDNGSSDSVLLIYGIAGGIVFGICFAGLCFIIIRRRERERKLSLNNTEFTTNGLSVGNTSSRSMFPFSGSISPLTNGENGDDKTDSPLSQKGEDDDIRGILGKGGKNIGKNKQLNLQPQNKQNQIQVPIQLKQASHSHSNSNANIPKLNYRSSNMEDNVIPVQMQVPIQLKQANHSHSNSGANVPKLNYRSSNMEGNVIPVQMQMTPIRGKQTVGTQGSPRGRMQNTKGMNGKTMKGMTMTGNGMQLTPQMQMQTMNMNGNMVGINNLNNMNNINMGMMRMGHISNNSNLVIPNMVNNNSSNNNNNNIHDRNASKLNIKIVNDGTTDTGNQDDSSDSSIAGMNLRDMQILGEWEEDNGIEDMFGRHGGTMGGSSVASRGPGWSYVKQ